MGGESHDPVPMSDSAPPAENTPSHALDYRSPSGGAPAPLDAPTASQAPFAESLLFAAWGVAVASLPFPGTSIPQRLAFSASYVPKTVGNFLEMAIDPSGGEVALAGKCVLALALMTMAASPLLIMMRRSSRSGFPLLLMIPVLLIWPAPYLALFDEAAWQRGMGLTVFQLAATAAFVAIVAQPHPGRASSATAEKLEWLRLAIAFLGAVGGVGFAIGVSALIGTFVGQSFFPRDDIAASLLTLAFDAILVVTGLIVGVVVAWSLASGSAPAPRSAS